MVFSSLLQASPIPFSPIVRNYSVSDYNAGIQNWAIAQDERGVMYFGNTVGCWNLMEVLGGCMNYRQKELCVLYISVKMEEFM